MSDDNRVDAIVVGAGLAGLACAWSLAGAGLQVLVLERGDAAGTKAVTGGRLYLNALRALEPELVEALPLERRVVRESWCLMSDTASTTVSHRSERRAADPVHSATVLRSRLDGALADEVGERGGFVVPASPVRELVKDGDRVTGVVAGDETLLADVVVLADGALSLLAEQAGLRGPLRPSSFALGVKEVLALDRGVLEDRFALEGDEGEARLFLGAVTGGRMGGGFLYTHVDTVSLGVVVGVGAYRDGAEIAPSAELMETFRARPEIRPLIDGAKLVEYSAHVVPEDGVAGLHRLCGDGVVVAGDAAGLSLNHGLTVRGMDLALGSGLIAARAVRAARDAGDTSAAGLACYERMLRETFVLQDLETHRDAPRVLARPRLYGHYPPAICELLDELLWFGDGPKPRFAPDAIARLRRDVLNLDGLRDAWEARRL